MGARADVREAFRGPQVICLCLGSGVIRVIRDSLVG